MGHYLNKWNREGKDAKSYTFTAMEVNENHISTHTYYKKCLNKLSYHSILLFSLIPRTYFHLYYTQYFNMSSSGFT